MQRTTQVKWLYMKPGSTGNKEEAPAVLENCDLIGITETWCDESYNWSMAIGVWLLMATAIQKEQARKKRQRHCPLSGNG